MSILDTDKNEWEMKVKSGNESEWMEDGIER